MTTYYVATNGSNSGNGSTESPWKTINHAMSANLRPGDEVVVRPGTYNESVNITRDGSADGYVTLRSEVPGEALIRPPSSAWNAISVNADYIVVEGFDIGGARGDGIEANNVHHIVIRDNVVHGSGESGIQFNWSEFITVEGNTTYGNASSGWFSGISIYQNRNITGDTTTQGFRTIVRDNVSYDNVTYGGQHTDGNGIIIDDFQSTQTSGFPNYTFPTLVENNLVYNNGGKGIQVTWSDHVTVRGNTAWHNNLDNQNSGTWRGELSNSASSNNTWVDNIAVADPSVNQNNTAIDNTSTGGYRNQNIVWEDNLTFNGATGQTSVRTDGNNAMASASNGNLLGVDPRFVDPENGDFRLESGSPAAGIGYQYDGAGPTPEPVPDPNTAPVAADDSGFSTPAGEALSISSSALLSNDTDADGDSLSVTGVGSATHGSVSRDSGGNVTFTPEAGYQGEAGFSYTISDGKGGTDSARVTVVVQAKADPIPEPQPDPGPSPTSDVLFRWNGGTSNVAAVDGGPAWIADAGAIVGSASIATHDINISGTLDGSVPGTTPGGIFAQEYWGDSAGAGMGLEFGDGTLEAGLYAVRLFMGNGFSGTNDPGERLFDVRIEGGLFLDDLDLSATLGHRVGGMFEWQGAITDGTIDIDFGHVVQSPLINGVEILRIDAGPAPEPEPANSAPKANDDTGFNTGYGSPILFSLADLLSNDTDADGDSLTITGLRNATNGTVNLNSGDAVFTPADGFSGAASFTYDISDGKGGLDSAVVIINVAAPADEVDGPSFSLWDDSARPDILSDPDSSPVEVGLKFVADVDAELDALRFYTSSENDGVRSVSLWSADGALLATRDVSGITSAGWHEVAFDIPISLEKGQTYIASYFTTSGHYSVSENYFNEGYDAGPITVYQNAGVYTYSDRSTLPTSTYNASNYWIDMVLDTDDGTNGGSAGPDVPSPPNAFDLIGEAGVVSVDQATAGTWHKVHFAETLDDPSIVMSGMSANNSDPFTIRVRNVSDDGFEFQIDEWDYLDGRHGLESIGWLAIESGVHNLADGRTVAAGSASVGGSKLSVDFGGLAFSDTPAVFAQVVSDKTKFALNDRIEGVKSNGFSVRLEQQEAKVGKILNESLDWVALEHGASSAGSPLVGETGNVVTHRGKSIDLGGAFPNDDFLFLTDMQTRDGADSATVQTVALDTGSVTIRILEETSRDTETTHTTEQIAYLGIELGKIYGHDVADLLLG